MRLEVSLNSRGSPTPRFSVDDALDLSDNCDIASIKCLATLQRLQVIIFHGDTNVLDGDLSVLKQLRGLKGVSIKNRPHYSHKLQDFDQSYWVSEEFKQKYPDTAEFLAE